MERYFRGDYFGCLFLVRRVIHIRVIRYKHKPVNPIVDNNDIVCVMMLVEFPKFKSINLTPTIKMVASNIEKIILIITILLYLKNSQT